MIFNTIDFTTFNGKLVTTKEIYTNGSSTSGSFAVSEDMTQYDYLYIYFRKKSSTTSNKTEIIRMEDFMDERRYTFLSGNPDNSSRTFTFYGIDLAYIDSTHINIVKNCDVSFNSSGIAGGPTEGGSMYVYKIIGIKLI